MVVLLPPPWSFIDPQLTGWQGESQRKSWEEYESLWLATNQPSSSAGSSSISSESPTHSTFGSLNSTSEADGNRASFRPISNNKTGQRSKWGSFGATQAGWPLRWGIMKKYITSIMKAINYGISVTS